jgi:hypothetical protein
MFGGVGCVGDDEQSDESSDDAGGSTSDDASPLTWSWSCTANDGHNQMTSAESSLLATINTIRAGRLRFRCNGTWYNGPGERKLSLPPLQTDNEANCAAFRAASYIARYKWGPPGNEHTLNGVSFAKRIDAADALPNTVTYNRTSATAYSAGEALGLNGPNDYLGQLNGWGRDAHCVDVLTTDKPRAVGIAAVGKVSGFSGTDAWALELSSK